MLRPNLLFDSWRELPTSILALRFTDPDQPVTQIDDLIDFKDPADRKRLIQFLSIFGWILHDCFMTSIPCFHLDRSIGRSLTLNVSLSNGKVIGYQPAEQKEPSLAAIQREIDQLKNYVVTLTVKSNLPARDSFNQPQARAARNSLAARMISIPGLKKISGDPSPISNHHQP
jgi:hypothetical protein